MVKRLIWDSNFFGYEVGNCIVDSHYLDLDNFKKSAKKFDLVYIFSNQEIVNLHPVSAIELVDIKVLLEKKVNKDIVPDPHIVEYNANIHLYDNLLELAYLSGKYSRFRNDKNFKSKEYYKLYKTWLDKSINHTLAFKVLVKIVNGQMAGFVTLQKNSSITSQIGLISVNPQFQGLGLASQLIKSAEYESFKNGFTSFQVPTQQENKPALKLYKKNGFDVIQKKYVYHFWNRDK